MSTVEVQQTPVCDAMFPFITRPSTQFATKQKPEGKYKVTLLLDPLAEEHKAFLLHLHSILKEATKAAGKELKNRPAKKHLRPEDKGETGLYEATFHSQFKPKAFDAQGHLINGDLNVGNGSKVRVAYKWAPYDGFGGGITLYLQAIQIIELVEYAGGEASDFGFESSDGFNIQADYETEMGGEAVPAVPDDAMDYMQDFEDQPQPNDVKDDDIPF